MRCKCFFPNYLWLLPLFMYLNLGLVGRLTIQ